MAPDDDDPPPAPRQPPDPSVIERAERINSELMKFVRQARTASPPVRAKLQHQMRERLEAERAALLGNRPVLPEALRHYAVTFTEVQWLLDAWIATTEREADELEVRRDFIDVATRMLGEIEVLRQPDPVLDPPERRPGWWSALTRGLRADETGEPAASPWDEPDILV